MWIMIMGGSPTTLLIVRVYTYAYAQTHARAHSVAVLIVRNRLSQVRSQDGRQVRGSNSGKT